MVKMHKRYAPLRALQRRYEAHDADGKEAKVRARSELARWLLTTGGWGWVKRDDKDVIIVVAHVKGEGPVKMVITQDPEPGVGPVIQLADRHALIVKRLTLADLGGRYPTPREAARRLARGR